MQGSLSQSLPKSCSTPFALIFIPFQGGVVIVDSPGIGDSEKVCNIVLEYLQQAFAFIYVINSPNAGGTQDDRVSWTKHPFLSDQLS